MRLKKVKSITTFSSLIWEEAKAAWFISWFSKPMLWTCPTVYYTCLCVSMFRLQIQIWGPAVKSIIGSSTTRSCFRSMQPELSEQRCHWTERCDEVMDTIRIHTYVIAVECRGKTIWLYVTLTVWLWFSDILKVKGHYSLIVEAWDGAVDPRRSRLTLSVTVLDVDDNSPIFTQQTYNVSLPENSPKDTVIAQLKVNKWGDARPQSLTYKSQVMYKYNVLLFQNHACTPNAPRTAFNSLCPGQRGKAFTGTLLKCRVRAIILP